jgi:hypothetical protein
MKSGADPRSARDPLVALFAGHRFSEAGNTATLVETVAEDRSGLLYDLASAIFHVTADGCKLTPGKQQIPGGSFPPGLPPVNWVMTTSRYDGF